MSLNDVLEPFWRVFNVFDHGEFDVSVPDDVRIGFVFLLAFDRSLFMLETWLVEINLF